MDPRFVDALGLVSPLIAIGLAVWRGEEARTAGIAVGLAWIASALITPLELTYPSLWLMGVDVLLALWLTRMTMARRPLWLLIAAACSWLLVVNHIVFAANLGVLDWAFFSVSYVWSAGVLMCLVWAAARKRERSVRP